MCVIVVDTLEQEIVGGQTKVEVRIRRMVMKGRERIGKGGGIYPMPGTERERLGERLRWASKTAKFRGLLEELGKHKLTLGLMLGTIDA